MDNWKIGDKCFYMYHNKPCEGRILNVFIYGDYDDIKKISYVKVTVKYLFEKDENRLGSDTIELEEIFPTKKALMMHLHNLMEKSTNNYKRFENGKDTE